MHVVVLGAGVIGVTTAYFLTEQGHDVTVIDRAGEVASGASGGNGGQLSYSFTDAMASPALLAKLPKVIAGLHTALRFRPPLDAFPLCWGQAFLRQCTPRHARQNTLTVLALAQRSSGLMAELQSRRSLEFSHRRAGKLVLLGNREDLTAASEMCAVKRKNGCNTRVVTLEEATGIEPALAYMQSRIAGAIYSEEDDVGNPLEFSIQLADWLSTHRGTEFRLNTTVRRLVAKGGKLHSVETDGGTVQADAVIVCLGAWSARLLEPLGIRTNIYPMRGYSITLPPGENPNSVSITHLADKMVFSRLGEHIRIAGFADFIGFDTGQDHKRSRQLLDTARRVAPVLADYDADSIHEWGGFRPMTPDSCPVVGASRIKGLYLNTGHGMLGWTLACVTAHDVAACLPPASMQSTQRQMQAN